MKGKQVAEVDHAVKESKSIKMPRKPKRAGYGVVLLVVIVATLGFIAGDNKDRILGLLGPLSGGRSVSDTLDTSSLEKTYRELATYYDGTLDTQALIDGANRGLVEAAGDKYTVFMNAKETAEFEADLSGSIGGGVGIVVGLREQQPTVIRVLDTTPAAEAGLKAGDVIKKVNNESLGEGATTEQVVDKIRGAVGTTVKVVIERDGIEQEFSMTRKEITAPSVEGEVVDGIGVLTISRFDQDTASHAKKIAEGFKSQGVKGVILDLRGNGGGYVTAAQGVAGLWLNDKVVVSERTGGKTSEELKTGRSAVLEGVPTVVLVDGGSASASEIVAGALQDYNVATLIGEKTFGKGTVQRLVRLENGAQLKVTVARWYTPKGNNITEKGIEPQTVVTLTRDDVQQGNDTQKKAALELLAR